jgi:hypothetical protein
MKHDFYRVPRVLKTKNKQIISVLRAGELFPLTVGMETKSGGKVLTIKRDKHAVGNMMAEIGKPGYCVAVNAIVLNDDDVTKTKKRFAKMHGIVIALLLVSINVFSQPFLGLSLNNKGMGVQLGCVSNSLEFKAAYKVPFMRRDVPAIASFTIGKMLLLSNKEEDNYAIIPEIGYGYYRVKDFTAYDADPTGKTPIMQVDGFKPVYGLSITKDAYLGQSFISATHAAGGLYYSIGMKFFLYR